MFVVVAVVVVVDVNVVAGRCCCWCGVVVDVVAGDVVALLGTTLG